MNAIRSYLHHGDYAQIPAVSITRLKELLRSPLHYRYALEHPRESAPMKLGTAAHCAALEPERFARDYVAWTRRTDSGRAAPRSGKAWDDFVAGHSEKTILTADEYADAQAIAAAVRNDPTALRYIASGDPEVSLEWELDGRPCKGRVDWLTHLERPVLVGLKTARDCRHFVFGSAAAKLGYHLQWAFYFDGYCAITGEVPRVVEIVVESAPPHAVVVYDIPEDIIEQGRDEYRELLRILGDCEARGHWPGPATCEQTLTLPSWVYQADDDISELGLEA
jgi:hypothetical protein